MYRFLLVILLGVTLLTGGCGGGDSNRQAPFMVNADGVSTFDLNQLRSQLNTFPIGSLTALEEEGLLIHKFHTLDGGIPTIGHLADRNDRIKTISEIFTQRTCG